MRGRGTGARDGSGDRSYELSLLSDFHPDTHLRVVRGYLPVQQSRKGGVWGVLKKINKGKWRAGEKRRRVSRMRAGGLPFARPAHTKRLMLIDAISTVSRESRS